jgi:CRISPR-associated protein Csy2
MKRILLIPRIKVLNANALSSPYTIGFPAMTAWLGAMHALQRKLNDKFAGLLCDAIAVISHDMDLQTYKGKGDYVRSIIATANPLKCSKKTGGFERPPFIEEARCHLTISLVIEYTGIDKTDEGDFLSAVSLHLYKSMKIAGGDILDFKAPEVFKVNDDDDLKKLNRKLMPGYVIIERRDLMLEAMQKKDDAIDTMLDYLIVKHRSEEIEVKQGEKKVQWSSKRKTSGWIVPIATGFQGITELAHAQNQRDPNVPHRFAESVVTLGEFIMPYRICNLDNMLWHYHVDLEKNLYLCQQKEPINLTLIEE